MREGRRWWYTHTGRRRCQRGWNPRPNRGRERDRERETGKKRDGLLEQQEARKREKYERPRLLPESAATQNRRASHRYVRSACALPWRRHEKTILRSRRRHHGHSIGSTRTNPAADSLVDNRHGSTGQSNRNCCRFFHCQCLCSRLVRPNKSHGVGAGPPPTTPPPTPPPPPPALHNAGRDAGAGNFHRIFERATIIDRCSSGRHPHAKRRRRLAGHAFSGWRSIETKSTRPLRQPWCQLLANAAEGQRRRARTTTTTSMCPPPAHNSTQKQKHRQQQQQQRPSGCGQHRFLCRGDPLAAARRRVHEDAHTVGGGGGRNTRKNRPITSDRWTYLDGCDVILSPSCTDGWCARTPRIAARRKPGRN